MDIILKKVSVDSLNLVRLSIECLIHNLEVEISGIEKDYDSSSIYSKDFYRNLLRDKKVDLESLRSLYKQF